MQSDGATKGSSRYLWFICFVSALGGLLFGYDVVVVSGVIPQVVKQFQLTSFQLGILVSSVLWGCAIGSVVGGVILDSLGRKKGIIIGAFILFISALWSSLSLSTAHLIIARLMGGIGCGIATTACPLYISEISPEKHRGRMVTLYHLCVCTGIVLCVFVNWGIFYFAGVNVVKSIDIPFVKWFVVEQNWRAMFASEALPGALFLLLSSYLPESPRWLVKQNRIAESIAILSTISGPQKAHQISSEIKKSVSIEQAMNFLTLFTPRLRKPLILGVSVCILCEACGISAVLYYGPQLFEQAGLSLGYSLGGFSILAIVNMIFNLVAMRFIDTVGRKKLLSIGALGSMISLTMIGSLYLLNESVFILVIFFISFIAFFAFSLGPVKFVLLGEIFPNQIRGKAISMCTLCIWITSAVVAQLFPMMREIMPTGYIFFFFAMDIAVLLLVIEFLMPETKGQTIEEIEQSWLIDQ